MRYSLNIVTVTMRYFLEKVTLTMSYFLNVVTVTIRYSLNIVTVTMCNFFLIGRSNIFYFFFLLYFSKNQTVLAIQLKSCY